jgi:predicted nucleic acid-binding protein
MYLVDSSVYIHGFRDAAFGESLRRFHKKHLPHLVLSAVVVHELLVGAATVRHERSLRRGIVEPFRARQRLHVPARHTWELAASVDRRLRKSPNLASKLRTRSFSNDMLIAASAREVGAVILTDNREDFGIISRVLDIRYVEPWPGDRRCWGDSASREAPLRAGTAQDGRRLARTCLVGP